MLAAATEECKCHCDRTCVFRDYFYLCSSCYLSYRSSRLCASETCGIRCVVSVVEGIGKEQGEGDLGGYEILFIWGCVVSTVRKALFEMAEGKL